MYISVKQKGDFKKTENFLKRAINSDHFKILDKYGQEGVDALEEYTPKNSGLTAGSWSYNIHVGKNRLYINWNNSNMVGNVKIAILLQFGHATGTGGYVQGIDYLNPALVPIFDKISEAVWKEVTRK